MLAHAVLYVACRSRPGAHDHHRGNDQMAGRALRHRGTLANLLIGGLVVMRLTFVSFALPRATTVRVTAGAGRGTASWSLRADVGMALLVVAYAFCPSRRTSRRVAVFVPLYAVCLLLALMLIPLWLLWWSRRRLPEPDDRRRPSTSSSPPTTRRRTSRGCCDRSTSPPGAMAGRCGWSSRTTARRTAPSRSRRRRSRSCACSRQRPDLAQRRPVRGAQPRAGDHRGGDLRPHRRGLRDGPGRTGLLGPVVPRSGCRHGGAMQEPRQDTVTWFHRLRAWRRCSSSGLPGWARAWSMASSSSRHVHRLPARARRRGGGFPTGMNGEDTDLTSSRAAATAP